MDIKLDPIELDAAEKAINEFSYGDLITHEWLHEALECKVDPEEKLTVKSLRSIELTQMARIEAFKKIMLEDHLMMLESVRGYGYLVVEPNQQTLTAMNSYAKKQGKLFEKTQEKLSNINFGMLDRNGINENRSAANKLNAVQLFFKQKLASLKQDEALKQIE